jgi:hypothetical protein
MPTASIAAIRKRKEDEEKEKERKKRAEEDKEIKRQKHKVAFVRNCEVTKEEAKKPASRKWRKPRDASRDSDVAAEKVKSVAPANPSSDTCDIEFNSVNVIGERIIRAREALDGDELQDAAMAEAKKRLQDENAASRATNIDPDEELFADLQRLDVSASEVLPPALSAAAVGYRARDPEPRLEDFQPAPKWREEPIMLDMDERTRARMEELERSEGVEYPFDTRRSEDRHWEDLKRWNVI